MSSSSIVLKQYSLPKSLTYGEGLHLDFVVRDKEVAYAIEEHSSDPREQEEYAVMLMRLGVLCQHKGRATAVRDEGDRLVDKMETQMESVVARMMANTQEMISDVKTQIAVNTARKEERQKATRHGLDFEKDVVAQTRAICQPQGDIIHETGTTTGVLRNSKVGDCVVELGPDNVAKGSKVVIEAKQDKSYDQSKALRELEVAKDNRDASVGIFVFSAKSAPEGLEPMRVYDKTNIVVVWDAENPETDVYLEAALWAGRSIAALVQKTKGVAKKGKTPTIEVIETAVLDIQKQLGDLDTLLKSNQTIRNACDKQEKTVRVMREKITKDITKARETIDAMRAISS
jgi:hypothetical protein